MMNMRSSNRKEKEEKMSTVSDEMKCYFEKPIKPLVTNKSLEELLNKLKCGLVKEFEEKILEQNAKMKKLELIVSIHENAVDQLLVKCDDNEQFLRRSCLCFY